jgi:hypothetical protein
MQVRSSDTASRATGPVAQVRVSMLFLLGVAALWQLLALLPDLSVADQSPGFYAAWLAIDVSPALVYLLAVVLARTGRGGRTLWAALLVAGVALFALGLYCVLVAGAFRGMLLGPPCLVALALVQLFWWRAPQATAS